MILHPLPEAVLSYADKKVPPPAGDGWETKEPVPKDRLLINMYLPR